MWPPATLISYLLTGIKLLMHVLGGHVDGKINKDGLESQYHALHLGTCCPAPPSPWVRARVCVTRKEKWAIDNMRPQNLCKRSVSLSVPSQRKERGSEEQGIGTEVIQPGAWRTPANTAIINHGPLEDYDSKYRTGNHYRLGWQLKPLLIFQNNVMAYEKNKGWKKKKERGQGKARRRERETVVPGMEFHTNVSRRDRWSTLHWFNNDDENRIIIKETTINNYLPLLLIIITIIITATVINSHHRFCLILFLPRIYCSCLMSYLWNISIKN